MCTYCHDECCTSNCGWNIKMMYSLVLLIIYSLDAMDAARILAIHPFPVRSHFLFNHAILRSLNDAGHQITMITPFPQSEKENFTFTYIDSHFDETIYVANTTFDDVNDVTLSFVFNVSTAINVKQYCYNVMKLPEIQGILNSPTKLYDIMFVEIWFEHFCFTPIAVKLAIPIVGTAALPTWKWADAMVGNPRNPAVIPEFWGRILEMNFVERIMNLWRYVAMDYYFFTRMREPLQQFYKDHFANDDMVPDKEEISLIFQNNFPSLLSRPVVANTIEIGGIHIEAANPLPRDLQKFIDEAPHGVVFFSLGSIVRASSMSPETRNAFLSAFESIPQRVIWKFEDDIEALPNDVITSSWFPQRDILEHKNVIAFMSHCGLGGVYEAVLTGTPLITIPIFADQFVNAEILQRRGVAVGLDLKTVTKEKILAALDTIINNTSYKERMQEFSLVFKDRPMTPQESVVYWTEYVIRHNGTKHLEALGKDMPLYEYLMLDILAIGILTSSIVVIFIFVVVRIFCFENEAKSVSLVKKRK